MTALYGVVGKPVAHSLSPAIHNAWIQEHGLDATYDRFEIDEGALAEGLTGLLEDGAMGLNITLPHKQEALKLARVAGDVAQRIGAANTLIRLETGDWRAENTDAPGFAETLINEGIDVGGQVVCLLGAGGAARAVALALSDLRADLLICNRTVERAEAMVRDLGIDAEVFPLSEASVQMGLSDMTVNTLSLGHTGGNLEIPHGPGKPFYDISYGKAAEGILEAAAAQEWRTIDGLGMLVSQAAFSFEHWFGILPDTAGALKRCRELVEAGS